VNSKWLVCGALVCLAIVVPANVVPAPAQVDLNRFLVGKWHQEVGAMVAETVFTAGHAFTSLAWTRGTPYRTGASGRWEIKYGDQLWQYNDECSPDPCAVKSEGTKIEVIDDDRIRNKFGVAYRMR